MGLFSIFSKTSKRDSEWQRFVDGAPDKKTKEVLGFMVDNFLIPDKINPVSFKANYEILRHNSRGLYKSHASLVDEPDFSNDGTKTIDELAKLGNQPLGYRDWFIAAYPDVIMWFQDLKDQEAMEILGNLSDNEVFDEEHKIKSEYLRKIVDSYQKKLECSK